MEIVVFSVHGTHRLPSIESTVGRALYKVEISNKNTYSLLGQTCAAKKKQNIK